MIDLLHRRLCRLFHISGTISLWGCAASKGQVRNTLEAIPAMPCKLLISASTAVECAVEVPNSPVNFKG